MTLPTKDELHAKAVAGEEITQDLVSELAKQEVPERGNPPTGGIAGNHLVLPDFDATHPTENLTTDRPPHLAMAQSIHDKQENFKAVAAEITSKPEAELTKEDAKHLMSAEVGLHQRIESQDSSMSSS